jgi:hypothetical protein
MPGLPPEKAEEMRRVLGVGLMAFSPFAPVCRLNVHAHPA